VLAVGSHQQVSLYGSDTGDFLGVLPFPQGFPHEVKFSRSGKLLLAAGGHGGKSGDVVLWNLADGAILGGVSGEYDSVLTADISPDQSRIALGGTDRLLKIFETSTGALLHKVKKHTDWVTSVEFSPDGKYLISGDRGGNVLLWEAGGASELFALNGHKGPVSSVSWRSDSAMVLSASEDGTIKVWRPSDGELVKSWTAHNAVLDARFGMNGSIVSSGRDGKATLWDVTGKALKPLALKAELPNRVVLSHDGSRAWVSDFSGWVAGFGVADGKQSGRVPSVPPKLEQRIAEAGATVNALDQKLREAAAQETALRIALEAARGKRAEMEGRLGELRSEIARVGERVEHIEKAVTSEEPTAEAGQLPELKARLADIKAEVTSIKNLKLPEMMKQIAGLEKKHAEALAPLEKIRAEQAAAKERLQHWQAAQESSKRRLASLKN
jgi:dipeptidyl aminopeptidase/acylaminoacyl peptidase